MAFPRDEKKNVAIPFLLQYQLMAAALFLLFFFMSFSSPGHISYVFKSPLRALNALLFNI